MIFRRNNLSIGAGLSMIFTMLVFGILYGITQLGGLPFKVRTIALIAICCNMLLIQQFKKNRAGVSIRGVVFSTMGLSILWAVWFWSEIGEELQY